MSTATSPNNGPDSVHGLQPDSREPQSHPTCSLTNKKRKIEEIPASSFFKTNEPSNFIPPALAPGRPRQIALRALQSDEKNRWKIFRSQSEAFEFCDSSGQRGLAIWAFEIDKSGRRRFVAASYHAFWRMYGRMLRKNVGAHFYEVIRNQRATKLYLDLEFQRAQNKGLDGEVMTHCVIEECFKVSNTARDDAVVILDSTTENKFSRHVIFQNICFHDNVQMGDFMLRVVQCVCEKDETSMLVFKEDGSRLPFVDLGVYTRNRCFRLVGSSKYGKTSRLMPENSGADRVSISRSDFYHSLACTVRKGVKLHGNRMAALAKRQAPAVKRMRSTDGTAAVTRERSQIGSYQNLDDYIYSLIIPSGGGIYNSSVMTESENVSYTIKGGYKYCANIGRHHKSNNVILIADLRARTMYQKCFDPDCRGFRSLPWQLPDEIFASVSARVDDDMLNGIMDQLEGRDGSNYNYDGGIPDDLLVTAVDQAVAQAVVQKVEPDQL